ncbi:MAG: formate dehydrogenase subunit alpha [Bdellovibrionia bacterium]
MKIEKLSIRFTVDGQPALADEDSRLIDYLISRHAKVPHVCYHSQLGPIETCDTCMVEVDGQLVRACATKISKGMTVETKSQRAESAQREAFNHIISNHLLYCTVCDNNNGDCTVHNNAKDLGIEHQEIEFSPKPYEVDTSNPFYQYDPDQCVLCGRCVEACQNVEVNETLTINWEDQYPRVLWDGGRPIGESSCVSCGHCVTVCPCNALMEKSMLGKAGYLTALPAPILDGMIDVVKAVEPDAGLTPLFKLSQAESDMRESRTKKTKTVCVYCGVGCSFDIWTRDRHILKVAPYEGPVNGISTCVKGKFGWDYVNSPDRLTTPLIRDGENFREASWDEALTLIAKRFNEIKARHGADALGFVASSKCTNEEAYLMQKLARAVVGTNNVDNCSRYCQSPATKGLTRTVGYAGDSGTIEDMMQADLVLIVGSNTAESHPVIASRIKEAQKCRGQKMIVVDIRKHEMAERADVFMHAKPGTDSIWASAIARYILDQGLENKEFLSQWVNGLDDYKKSLEPFTLQFASDMCGVTVDELKRIAHMIVEHKNVCLLWAMGVTQHTMGSDTSSTFSNLLLITGNYMRPGTGAYPLRGHNNVQGTGDLGASPDKFPGYQKVSDDDVRKRFEEAWGVKLTTNKGLDNHEMIDAIHNGKLRAMYVYGEEINLVESNIHHVEKALEKLEFFVVQEIFFNQTCRLADVILPACPSLEKEGTFTNTERRIQRLYQVFEPLEGTRPDWRIIQDVANALGADWNYKHPSEVFDEVAKLAPIFAGVNYERLEGYKSLHWPVAWDGKDAPLLYTDGFPFPDKKAKLHPIKVRIPQEQVNEEFDIHLNNGRLLEHFHEGVMTYRSSGLRELVPDTFVEISPHLAEERGIQDGTVIKLISRWGELQARALVTHRVTDNEIYMPVNSTTARVNLLTGAHTDDVTHTPAYKENSVRIEVLPLIEGTPLPRTNHRYGHRTPQKGVEVERKWNRPDYQAPQGAPLPPQAEVKGA